MSSPSLISRRVLFLPGASGAGEFWRPVAERLPDSWDKVLFDWPGLGAVPSDPSVSSFDDLADMVIQQLDGQADLVAQSMGGVVAIKVALARPEMVRRLVLTATSGGVDLGQFNAADWRAEYRAEYPNAAAFVTEPHSEDHTSQLASIAAPTLLLWAADDAISPPDVGRFLQQKLKQARLVVLQKGEHMFARDLADQVAPLIEEHLA